MEPTSRAKRGISLCLVRHGRAGGNRAHIFNGSRRDVPLTALGRKQAKELARNWTGKPDAILSSPMKRARSTAGYLARKYRLPVVVVPDTHEQNIGKWTGKSAVVMCKKHPDYFFRKTNGKISHYLKKAPGGETWGDILKRARRFLAFVRKTYPQKRVVLIAHGVFILACVSVLTGIKPPKLWDLHVKNAHMICERL
ncbi:2,3-bisphosphoglycerate-dependent phosphoglycerate mutase [uncultured archaeon]|nr:2,3-bisphosphoglycerate-dependent phosphoglycerate mutase [uncultured archaeon]